MSNLYIGMCCSNNSITASGGMLRPRILLLSFAMASAQVHRAHTHIFHHAQRFIIFVSTFVDFMDRTKIYFVADHTLFLQAFVFFFILLKVKNAKSV